MELKYDGHSKSGGIYKITNTSNGRTYYGSTKCFQVRWSRHATSLKHGKHHNNFLQRDFNKCGTVAFIFEVLEVVIGVKEERLLKEETYLKQYFDHGKQCYNLRNTATSGDECRPNNSETTRKLKSEASKRRWQNEGAVKEHSECMKIRWESEEFRESQSSAMKECWGKEGYRENISEKACVAATEQWKRVSAEERAVISEKAAARQIGKKCQFKRTPEQTERSSVAAYKRQERKLQKEADEKGMLVEEYRLLPKTVARLALNAKILARSKALRSGAPRMRKPKRVSNGPPPEKK